ncbi:MAG: lysophospholipid acyltransferase family protein [Victivallaceae bacterium]|nr:lysophospholipid acyltransferase family protein [Victivallaceae bacterium]
MKKIISRAPGDAYDTPENHPRAAVDRLLFGSRLYFYLCNFGVFIRTGICAKHGELDAERQIHYSNMNFDLVENCGGRIHLRGLNNLDRLAGKPAVIIGNHMSLLETAVLHAIVRPRLDFTFVIKESLLDVPFFGNIMRSLHAIPVTRRNPKEDFKQVLALGRERLERGCSVILFPQATRSAEFNPELFNSIGVKLARTAGVPVIPLALKTDFIGNGRFLRDMGPLHRNRAVWFEFGEPLAITGTGKAEQEKIVGFIQTRLNNWRAGE